MHLEDNLKTQNKDCKSRYDDNDNIGDGDYGDDAEDFGDIDGSGGSDGEMVAAVPSVWQEFYDDSAQAKYWYNAATGEASWVQPEDQKQGGSISSSPTNRDRNTSRTGRSEMSIRSGAMP